jgi:hypothetical protein
MLRAADYGEVVPMRHTREQKRAELLKAAEAMIDEFLDWEERA